MNDSEKLKILELRFNNGDSFFENPEYIHFCKTYPLTKNYDISGVLVWLGWRFLINIDDYTNEHKNILRKEKLLKINTI